MQGDSRVILRSWRDNMRRDSLETRLLPFIFTSDPRQLHTLVANSAALFSLAIAFFEDRHYTTKATDAHFMKNNRIVH